MPPAFSTDNLQHSFRAHLTLASLGAIFIAATLGAQEPPPVAMRPVDVRRDALVNLTLVATPGERLTDAVVVMKDGWIEAVGARGAITLPEGTTIHDCGGGWVYAGFIDACVRIESQSAARAASSEQGAHWNSKVTPQVNATLLPPLGAAMRKDLRAIGFTAAAIHPNSGIFRGGSQLVLIGDEPRSARTIVEDAGMSVAFEVNRGDDNDRSGYPDALIGSLALTRQTFADAAWHAASCEVWSKYQAGNEPPVLANALSALHQAALGKERVWFDASDERNLLRANALATDLSLDAGFIGSGREYRSLDAVRATGKPVVVSFDFPKAPDTATPRAIDAVALKDLLHWALAPTNLSRLLRAGVPAAASTVRLKDVSLFTKAAQRSIQCGVTEDELLAALTVNPAKMLGVAALAGEVRPGRMANLLVCSGPLFGVETKTREVWIAGLRHEVEPVSKFPLKGVFTLGAPLQAGPMKPVPLSITLDGDEKSVSFTLPEPVVEPVVNAAPAQPTPVGGQVEKARAPVVQAQSANFEDGRSGFVLPGKEFGVTGSLRGMIVATRESARVVLTLPDASEVVWDVPAANRTGDVPDKKMRRKEAFDEAKKDAIKNGKEPPASEGDDEAIEKKLIETTLAGIPNTWPLANFGVEQTPQPTTVLVEHATIWTVTDQGILANADLLIRDGKIAALGSNLRSTLSADEAKSARIIDGTGLHVTPGLIDCHSHTGIDGGVNEGGQNVTAEVRIADVVNAEDPDWYRQLAGGLTAVNQLHGSANPIGGQNSVVKIRWGEPASAYPIKGAIPGIKFALGENVTRSKQRYPDSRLGVETLIRDRFQSAREWRNAQESYRALSVQDQAHTMPPRPDFELQALAEILEGKRLVHCHSYRQDEIMMLIGVARDFKFQIGTFQHVLEGYKVADEIAKSGAGASSFSDWWAYKMEVMDAIPWNGQMLWKAGVVTSFNSDSDELARRMNTEAAKAVRYGGVPREEAIKFVTINPAKQLRIDGQTGSLAVGKDADFVIWSADPLSVYARCLETFVDGASRFSLATDRAMRERDAVTRNSLIALVVADPKRGDGAGDSRGGRGKKGKPGTDPEKQDAPAAPVEQLSNARAAGGLLLRMRQAQERQLLEIVRSGVDPESMKPGECGCDQSDTWRAIFETTLGAGGMR